MPDPGPSAAAVGSLWWLDLVQELSDPDFRKAYEEALDEIMRADDEANRNSGVVQESSPPEA